jgi:hypothetical protein
MASNNDLERWSPLVLARISGILGLIGIAFGAFDIGHIRGALIVAGNPSLTVQNILAHETLFRLGFTGHLLEMLCNAVAEVILPRFLGVLGGIAGFCYVINTLLSFVAPALHARLTPYILYACFPGEALGSLWLATIGLNVVKWRAWRTDAPASPPIHQP